MKLCKGLSLCNFLLSKVKYKFTLYSLTFIYFDIIHFNIVQVLTCAHYGSIHYFNNQSILKTVCKRVQNFENNSIILTSLE